VTALPSSPPILGRALEKKADQADLTRIARIVAATTPSGERWDVYQGIWERFLRYTPRSRTGAWLMAYHARNDRYRDEAKRRHEDSEGAEAQKLAGGGEKEINDIAGQIDDRARLDELWAKAPIEMAILTGYVRQIAKGEKITGAQRVRVFRVRKRLLKSEALYSPDPCQIEGGYDDASTEPLRTAGGRQRHRHGR
jgi:hypothetical protein